MSGQDSPEVWTVGKVLAWAAKDFQSRGMDTPRLEAELLLCRVVGLDRVRLIIESMRLLSSEELAAYKSLIVRRRASEPVAYLLGEREFYGHRFRVDSRVLIPRPDTEALVDVALSRTRARSQYGRALDLCTGSGCVAVAFTKERPTWKTTVTDVSAEALSVARHNAERLGVAWTMAFRQGDLYGALPSGQRFELVTANPPYIPEAELSELQAGIRNFEPHLALFGGDDGLSLVRRVVAEAPAYLEAEGVLAMEVGHDQAPRVSRLFEQAGFQEVERRRDLGGHERVVSGILAG